MSEDKKKPGRVITKEEIVVAFAVSGAEIALYIIVPILAGYLIGKEFGGPATALFLFIGAILGLALAVRRATKMAV